MTSFQVVSPVDGRVLVTLDYATDATIAAALQAADKAQADWQSIPLAKRAEICRHALQYFVSHKKDIALEITRQMGRPIRFGEGEIGGLQERANYMIDVAASSLADLSFADMPGFKRYIRREPVGNVLVLAPWNYPYLTAVNTIFPALMAGNAVLLKHSAQTPLCAERFYQAFQAAGLPEGLFQFLHLTHQQVESLIQSPQINYVAFTGSVAGGHKIEEAACGRFIGVGLELGGKDPAYVRADADIEFSVENLVDGAFFNSGQSCCGIERIYVDQSVYARFVEGFVELTRQYRLGDPLQHETTLGPVVSVKAAQWIRDQVARAVAAGAKACIDPGEFAGGELGENYLPPQVLVDVSHEMDVMTEETFGPVVGIMPVADDEQALALMNDSDYGLTASLWTRDLAVAESLGRRLQTGTVFMNRSDYLDPALVWTGVKNTGRGGTLSQLGYDSLTQPKSFHLRVGS